MQTRRTAVVLAAGLLARAPWHTFAQSTTATCGSQYSWMDNEKGQSPCLVAAYLNGQCLSVPAASTVLPLEQLAGITDYYAPPSTGLLSPTDCNCNTVLYSLLAACGACQDQGFTTWKLWEANCPTVFVTKFPDDIPSAVSVPQWAYLDVTSDNDFNVTAALSLANEHKPDATSSSSSSSGSGSTSTHKKSIVGPVVGGVVGGLGGLAIVGLGIWFWLRRRNQRKENTPAAGVVTFDNGGTPVPQSTPDIEKPGYIHSPLPLSAVDGVQQLQQQPLLSYSGASPEQQQYQQQQALLASPPPSTLRPYNPDDPSTFPDALLYSPPSTQTYAPSGQTSPTSYNTPLSSNQNRPLSSVPEVSSSYVPEVSSGYVPEVSSGYVPPAQHQHHQQPQQQTGGGYQPTEF